MSRNYDVWGASSTPGPNAPLGNLCGTSKQPQASAHAALAQWKAAGFPPHRMLLGIPLYGYVSKSTATTLTADVSPSPEMLRSQASGDAGVSKFLSGAHPKDKTLAVSEVTAQFGDLSTLWGQQIAFNQILSVGVLKKQPDGSYHGANGYTKGEYASVFWLFVRAI